MPAHRTTLHYCRYGGKYRVEKQIESKKKNENELRGENKSVVKVQKWMKYGQEENKNNLGR
jgi:hypothetical protein